MEQPFSTVEATGGQEEGAVGGGGDALQASAPLKVTFGGKMPSVTLQSFPF